MLHERGLLDFEDRIAKYLDPELMDGLHLYKGRHFSDTIQIKHLLQQTSGLNDFFFPLFKKMLQDPGFRISPRDAIQWGKEHLRPVAVPGKKHFYTDTNYHLLGLIVESITGKSFHEFMHEQIFNPLGMKHAFMYGYSTPEEDSGYKTASPYFKGTDFLSIEGIHEIDYAGGSVVAPLADFHRFMRALVNHEVIQKATLERMIQDDVPMGFPILGFNYGYSIWKTKPIPVLLPSNYYCWGCVGVTGAFMFYHVATESYIIGTFNDFSYRGKALQFMINKVIKALLKYDL